MPEDCNFAATLSARARAQPGKAALIEPGKRQPAGRPSWRRITFGELESLANGYAHGLARSGVRRGDRVLYLLRPSIEAYAVFYGLLRLGAIPIVIDPGMGLRRLLPCIEGIRPRVVLAVPLIHAIRTFARRPFATAEVLITAGRRWFWGGRSLRQCLAESKPYEAEPSARDDECFIPFTSGSTGPAKGVSYNHGMLLRQVRLLREVCGWREEMSVVMCFAAFVPCALANGLTTILPDIDFSKPAAARPRRVIEALTEHGAQCAFASPIVWMNLVRYCQRHRIELRTLQHAVTAGAPVPIDLHRRLRGIIHREGRLYTPYGATEALPITTIDTEALAETWKQTRRGYGTCVGKPVTGIDVWVIRVTDEAIPTWSDDLCVPEGEIGELVVGGAVVSPAYKGRPEESARAKIRRDGCIVHRMGDLGRLDANGRVWFCGRKSHRIETRDGMLAPVPLENIFNEHQSVFRTAVVGIGPTGAQTPVACVEMEQGETFSPQLEAELAALADGTRWSGVVRRFLPHRGFPVDARHNSKIKREELAVWAEKALRQGAGDAVKAGA